MSERNHPSMSQNLFTYLPSEINLDILSRLPVRAVASCKCVCKSWLCLLETHEFVMAHLSKAVPALVCFDKRRSIFELYEFKDGLDIEEHELHYSLITDFDLDNLLCHDGHMCGSVNGLLLLTSGSHTSLSLYLCNPITRKYIKLQGLEEFLHRGLEVVSSGIGVSKISGEYKGVLIFNHYSKMSPGRSHELLEVEVLVHTIGTRSWRRVVHVPPPVYETHNPVPFFNGNLHWLATDANASEFWISVFDLETELFSTFSPPFQGETVGLVLCALQECLCLCVNSSEEEMVFWLMKEYGVEKSWRKEFVMSRDPNSNPYVDVVRYEHIFPIKVFENGDILMDWNHVVLFYYSKEKNTTQRIYMFDFEYNVIAIHHTPSFLSLDTFGMEDIRCTDLNW